MSQKKIRFNEVQAVISMNSFVTNSHLLFIVVFQTPCWVRSKTFLFLKVFARINLKLFEENKEHHHLHDDA